MKHNSLIKRIQKQGFEISTDDFRCYLAKGKTKNVVWYKQNDYAVAVHTPSRHTDIQTDCHCDIFHRTIKAVLTYLNK